MQASSGNACKCAPRGQGRGVSEEREKDSLGGQKKIEEGPSPPPKVGPDPGVEALGEDGHWGQSAATPNPTPTHSRGTNEGKEEEKHLSSWSGSSRRGFEEELLPEVC